MQRRVNVDFPSWMIDSLNREAQRLGVTRQSIIKIWIAERLERKTSRIVPRLGVARCRTPWTADSHRLLDGKL